MEKKTKTVPFGQRFFGALVCNTRPAQFVLSALETEVLKDDLEGIKIEKPVYVCSLARSGTTIILDLMSRHPDLTAHRYHDYPPVYTPYWSNWIRQRLPARKSSETERLHADGMKVTPESPEAREEIFWMNFFDNLHNPQVKNVLDETTSNPEFEKFYRDHIKKLLLVRGAKRYLSKGNYNVTRMAYIQKIFPDARFVLPVRHPVWHIASSLKTHRIFMETQAGNASAVRHLRRVGHFEFGQDRCPVNPGNTKKVGEILELWSSAFAEDHVRGWARYWALMFHYIDHELKARPALGRAALVVRYEDLLADPVPKLSRLYVHADLEAPPEFLTRQAALLKPPGYYKPEFTRTERAIIWEETGEIAARYGYKEDPV